MGVPTKIGQLTINGGEWTGIYQAKILCIFESFHLTSLHLEIIPFTLIIVLHQFVEPTTETGG